MLPSDWNIGRSQFDNSANQFTGTRLVYFSPTSAIVHLQPEIPHRCLLVQPKFAETNYWNFADGARSIGAKATAPPLGLLTVAAILPQNWEYRVVDLNVRGLEEADWDWADIVCTGGMLPQQRGILQLINECKRRRKFVVVGGPDPTSQPQLYSSADARVLGEGESSIPNWLNSWGNSNPTGEFLQTETPDVTQTPIPRFDLIEFDDYLHVGVQSSRGCPYNCEFCDIIELFGRKPRVKTPEQFTRELDRLRELGYRGWVDITDDNFIGNRLKIKPVLRETARWSKRNRYPFVFSTEASVNLADDDELLALMQECQFRYVFLGIETPDPEVLAQTQKRINTVEPLIDRVRKIYASGMSITAGFILGFDSESESTGDALIEFIEESGIMLAMVGLLTALPNTQLTRRLAKERRLIDANRQRIIDLSVNYELISDDIDQTIGGLNFVTVRDRVAIYRDMQRVVAHIYSAESFMNRVLDTTSRLRLKPKHRPNLWEFKRLAKGFLNVAIKLLGDRESRWLYLRNSMRTLLMGPSKFEFAQTLMGSFPHFSAQSKLVDTELEKLIVYALEAADYPRSVSEMPASELPVVSVSSHDSKTS